ncbi:MAG: hypothetical protein GY850_19955 [bacterium]|nr:hypothetical protein [bacterium]
MNENDGKTKGTSGPVSHDSRQDELEDFVGGLLKKTARLQQKDLDPDLQLAIALLIDLLSRNRRGFVYTHKVYFEAAFELLAAEKPNLVLLQRLLSNLQVAEERVEGGLTGLIIKFCGLRPATAMLAGLVSIFGVLCLALLLLVLGHTVLSRLEQVIDSIHPMVQLLDKLPTGHICIIVFSSFLGSVVSVVTRIGYLDQSSYRPLSIYMNVLFRPLISLAFALFIYAVLQTGLISFLGLSLEGAKGIATLWVVGFLAGYSERFSKDFISETETKMGL